MANQTVVSSLIGANLSATGSTALFALGTVANTDDGGVYEYVEATATYTTGQFVMLTPSGTANNFITAKCVFTAIGIDIGAFQNTISQGEFGWVAKKGRSLYVLCTGTIAASASVGLAAVADGGGRLQIATGVAVGHTLLGIYVTTSASTGTASVATGTLTWPRAIETAGG